jgi:hypothetical protein
VTSQVDNSFETALAAGVGVARYPAWYSASTAI